MIFAVVVLVLVCCSQTVLASAGNEDHRYRGCLSRCVKNNCRAEGNGGYDFVDKSAATWELLLFGWSCDDDCRYHCATENRELRVKNGEQPVQYHGKWGFDRVFGIQELFSSLFSVLNAVPHILHLQQLNEYRKKTEFGGHWLSFAVVGVNTWFWSALFHARDTPFTEKMDYFSALFLIVWGLWVAIVRTLHLHRRKHLQALILAGIMLFYLGHISYLTFVRFDYGYNILINTVMALLGSVFWLFWLWRNRTRKYIHLLFWAIVGVYPMTLLELLDFPPFFNLLDAHALWHFSTIPFSFVMYAGVIADLKYSHEHGEDNTKSA